jgi:UDP-3-O-[3-hydroxymyristoyl] glucosamine N-acyltransferase
VEITGVAGVQEAREGDLTFLASPRYEAAARETRAGAILVGANHREFRTATIEIGDPYRAFLEAVKILRPPSPRAAAGVHPTAVIGAGVELADGVSIGAHAVLESGAVIGAQTVIGPLTFIGRGARIGSEAHLYPGVFIREECTLGDRVVVHSGSVIGSDGFGFLWDGAQHVKVPQVGRVVIEDDVEIGAGCAIDRGMVGETHIGRGTKFDNLVHIGHNVRIGENSIVVAQVGIGGSTIVGRGVTLAGQVGIVGHVEIGDGVQIGAQAGVIGSVPAGSRIWGTPSMPLGQSKRVYAAQKRAPELLREVHDLKKRLVELEACLGREPAGTDSKKKAPGASDPAADTRPARRKR